MKTPKKTAILIPLAAVLLLSSCNKSENAMKASAPPVAEQTSLDAWFTANAPAGAQAIHVARTTAKPGDEITLSGLVMGRLQPFVDGRAAFVLGDPAKLTPCNAIPGDECETPWDVCCDSPEAKREGTATIQITGPDGRVLSTDLKGVNGLIELSKVTVTGIVDAASSAEALILNATALHVAN